MLMQLILLLIGLIGAQGAPTRSLVIFIDDFGPPVYPNNGEVKMPHIDALRKRSVMYKNGYTAVSSCSPSRSALLTGLPIHQNGMFGLHHGTNNFNSFGGVKSISTILSRSKGRVKTALIGKKHVGPDPVYYFDFEYSNKNVSLEQVGRNITFYLEKVKAFSELYAEEDTMLYLAPFDTHRCGCGYCDNCALWGSGGTHGVIPDWTPTLYNPDKLTLPHFLPDTPGTRKELSNLYTMASRVDQGIGLVMNYFEKKGWLDDMLIILTADNGVPFPGAKTNLYDPGANLPFMVSDPRDKTMWGSVSDRMVSTLDIVPTLLDRYSLSYPKYSLMGKVVELTGKSLLSNSSNHRKTTRESSSQPINRPSDKRNALFKFNNSSFMSHVMHENTMYYPMRAVVNHGYKLIQNLNYKMPYPIAEDIATSLSFKDLMAREGLWYRDIKDYYYRSNYELYHLVTDPHEQNNIVHGYAHAEIFRALHNELEVWQQTTNDPWRCSPRGTVNLYGKCVDLQNEL